MWSRKKGGGEDIEKVRDGDGDGNSSSGGREEEMVSNSAANRANRAARGMGERVREREGGR